MKTRPGSRPGALARAFDAAPLTVAVVGGTGTLGRLVVADLRARGHRTRTLSRHAPDHPVDLATGRGLAAALDGCDVIVDASSAVDPKHPERTLVDATRRLLDAAGDAGVGHVVGVGIVGCEAVPMAYLAAKAAQQRVLEDGPLPWSTVRSTQFHSFVVTTLRGATRWGFTLVPRMPVQPVDAATAAHAVADAAAGPPTKAAVTVVGPAVRDLRDLARAWRDAAAPRTRLVPVRVPGAAGRALRAGALTSTAADVTGTLGFEAWLGGAS